MRDYCAACGADGPLYQGENETAYCEVCTHVQHGEDIGERFAHAEMFMVAARAANHHGISASDLHALVTEAVQDEGYEGADVPALVSIGESHRALREWLRPVDGADRETRAPLDQLEASIERSKKRSR